MTTGCDTDRLWALAVGVLDEDEVRGLDEHLTGCAPCRGHLGEIRADVDALGYRASAERSPEALAQQVLERSRQVQARARRLRWIAFSALLVAVLVGGVLTAHTLAVKAMARRDLWRVQHAVERIQDAEGRYPAGEAELVAALGRIPAPDVRLDPQGRPLDHWGRPYRYRYPGVHNPGLFDLWSAGANGEDEDGRPDDLTNWP